MIVPSRRIFFYILPVCTQLHQIKLTSHVVELPVSLYLLTNKCSFHVLPESSFKEHGKKPYCSGGADNRVFERAQLLKGARHRCPAGSTVNDSPQPCAPERIANHFLALDVLAKSRCYPHTCHPNIIHLGGCLLCASGPPLALVLNGRHGASLRGWGIDQLTLVLSA